MGSLTWDPSIQFPTLRKMILKDAVKYHLHTLSQLNPGIVPSVYNSLLLPLPNLQKTLSKGEDIIYVSFDTCFGHMPAEGLILLFISGTLHEDRQVSTLIKLKPNERMANREINQIISDTDKGHEEIKLQGCSPGDFERPP